jgi:hypothetical protein
MGVHVLAAKFPENWVQRSFPAIGWGLNLLGFCFIIVCQQKRFLTFFSAGFRRLFFIFRIIGELSLQPTL